MTEQNTDRICFVKPHCIGGYATICIMSNLNERLRQARREAGYESAADAAKAFGWKTSGYTHHENGTRGVKPDLARRYAKAFKKPVEWLLYGTQPKKDQAADKPIKVPLVGYVAAGSQTYFFSDMRDEAEPDMASAPAGSSEETVAVEIRGESLGPAFDRWLVFYDDVRRPVTSDLIGELCVVGLDDGRIMVKKIQRSKSRNGLFHLISNGNEAPILDVEIDWAAPVIALTPRR
jgi:SOS-response transcriptional repressor LexA